MRLLVEVEREIIAFFRKWNNANGGDFSHDRSKSPASMVRNLKSYFITSN
ncbi:hypothetical protein H1P_4990001 [Hyella patelloides LEGE 07179]|uniref:Uncharacterized protein n=1 Tax=Hyella patelloides LEGE 07179 TaxID=945734 RepID=A0A563VZE3_9CYAN|nr:hypothetical protein H1P_4990001 [Hyella patelloides LEGE 07179]